MITIQQRFQITRSIDKVTAPPAKPEGRS